MSDGLTGGAALAVATERLADPGDLLAQRPSPAASAWIHQGDGLVGWGEAARLTLPSGVDRFAAGEKWLAELFEAAIVTDEVGVPGTGPVAFGSFTFDPASDGSVLIVLLQRQRGPQMLELSSHTCTLPVLSALPPTDSGFVAENGPL